MRYHVESEIRDAIRKGLQDAGITDGDTVERAVNAIAVRIDAVIDDTPGDPPPNHDAVLEAQITDLVARMTNVEGVVNEVVKDIRAFGQSVTATGETPPVSRTPLSAYVPSPTLTARRRVASK